MSLATKLSFLGRHSALRLALVPLSSQRCASRLSAIHNGLNRSERARPQGSSPRKEIRQRPSDEPYLTPEDRRRARAIARQNPINFKIRKGKKDITEEPGPPRKSRKARFMDSRDKFAEGSLVKKFRAGQLFDGVVTGYKGDGEGNLQHDDFVRQLFDDPQDRPGPRKSDRGPARDRPRDFGRSEQPRGVQRSPGDTESGSRRDQQPWGDSRLDRRTRDKGNDERKSNDTPRLFERTSHDTSRGFERRSVDPVKGFDRRQHESRAPSNSFGPDQENRPYRGSERTRPTERKSHDADDADAAKESKPKRNDGPVPIPYTTAASQFLYGTSSVEAALKAGRRRMYKLYIYKGKGRSIRALEKDRTLGDLARSRGIKVEYLEEASLPMLNKMSDNRPHNGHVLEASPLPQPPTTALGLFSEDGDRPGFKVHVGYQSQEEAQINGTSGFVPTEPGSRKPLVLVVDQVLDPGNLGAILRTASFMGVTAVAISKKGSAPVTPVVLKSSAGAAESLTMFSVESVEEFLRNSKDNGWKVYAACPPKSDSKRPRIDTIDLEKDDPLLKDSCILLVGSEGEGLPRALRRAANVEISIPNLSGSDVVDSLNVSVATGLLCSAFLRGKAKAFGNLPIDTGAIF